MGILGPVKSAIRIAPNLKTAPETNLQTDLQASNKSLAELSPHANWASKYRAGHSASNRVENPFDVELARIEKHRLSPQPEDHEIKRQKLSGGRVSETLAVQFPVKPEGLGSPVEKPDISGYFLGTESLDEPVPSMDDLTQREDIQERDDNVQFEEDSEQKATGGGGRGQGQHRCNYAFHFIS